MLTLDTRSSAVVALLVLMIACVGIGALVDTSFQEEQQNEKTVRCSRLELVDKKGRLRGVLAVDQDDHTVLELKDPGERTALTLLVDHEGSSIKQISSKGVVRSLASAARDTSAFALMNTDGKPVVAMGVNSKGTPSLDFLTAEGTEALTLTYREESGLAALSLNPQGKGENSLFLTVKQGGVAAIGLRDKNDRLRATFGLDKEGNPTLRLLDAQEKTHWEAGK